MADTHDSAELLSTEEVAAYLKVSPRTVAGWRNAGIGPPYFHVNRRVRYRRGAIDDYVRGLEQSTANA